MNDFSLDDFLLENARDKKRKERSKDIPLPTEIKITKNALKKAWSVGPLVKEKSGRSFEWYSLLLGYKSDPENVVRDFILPGNQVVSGSHCTANGNDIGLAVAEIRKRNEEDGTDYQVIGWMHSHSNFSTFHSGTDTDNILTVLNSVSFNTEKAVYQPFAIMGVPTANLEGDVVKIVGKDIEDAVIEYDLSNAEGLETILENRGIEIPEDMDPSKYAAELLYELLNVSEFEVLEPKIQGFCYSIVVNDSQDTPDTRIAVIRKTMLSGQRKVWQETNLKLTIVEVDDDIEYNKDALSAEIDRKIILPKPRRSWWSRREKKRNAPEIPKNSLTERRPAVLKPVDSKLAEEMSDTCQFVTAAKQYVSLGFPYADYLHDVLKATHKRGGLMEAIGITGDLTSNTGSTEILNEISPDETTPAIVRSIIENDLSNKTMVSFIDEFMEVSPSKVPGLLEKYIPLILYEVSENETNHTIRVSLDSTILHYAKKDHDRHVKEFASTITSEAASMGRTYRYWTRNLMAEFISDDCDTLEEAIIRTGAPTKTGETNHVPLINKHRYVFERKLRSMREEDSIKEFVGTYISEGMFKPDLTYGQFLLSYARGVIAKSGEKDEAEFDAFLATRKRRQPTLDLTSCLETDTEIENVDNTYTVTEEVPNTPDTYKAGEEE